MTQRIFRIDDTSPWPDKYGTGAAGSATVSSDTTMGSTQGAYYGTLTGTAAQYTATTSNLGNGTYNLPCLIWQTQNSPYGAYEFNILVSVSSNTATLKYPLTNTYVAGAQIITANPYNYFTLNSSINLYAPSWNGSYGGLMLLFAAVQVSFNGNVQLAGRSPGNATNQADGGGFHGGQYVGTNNHINAYAGEGYSGYGGQAYTNGHASNAVNNAGAGGAWGSSPAGEGSGGGASNATSGTNGSIHNGGDNGKAGLLSSTVGANVAMTLLFLGPGGGSGASGDNSDAGIGGNGGAVLVVVSPSIIGSGNIYTNGGNGGQATVGGASTGGGAGASGGTLFKTQIMNYTGLLQSIGGTGGSNSQANGGNGGNGFQHADYLVSATATNSNPTLDTRFDPILASNNGFMLLM